MPHPTATLRLLAVCTLLLGSSLAHAQYSWIGENGVRHFSDRPPPPSTPPHKILKAPGRLPAAAPQAAPAPLPALQEAETARLTLAKRDAEFRERVKKKAEEEKKELAQAQRQRDSAERCEAARQARAQVESGIRISKMDANGERSFISDGERAEQLARANKILAECR